MDEYAASVATLVGMLGIDAGQAGTLLQNAGGNIEAAASEYFYMMEEGGGTDGEKNNTTNEYIANLTSPQECKAYAMKLSVAADGKSYTIYNPRNKHQRTFKTRKH